MRFTDLFVGRIKEIRDLVVGHNEAAIRTSQFVLHQIGIMGCQDRLEVLALIESQNNVFSRFIVKEGIKLVYEQERNVIERDVPKDFFILFNWHKITYDMTRGKVITTHLRTVGPAV